MIGDSLQLRVWGRVRQECEWSLEGLRVLPRSGSSIAVRDKASRGRSLRDFTGVSTRELLSRIELAADAAYAMVHGNDDYSICLPLSRFAGAGALLADACDSVTLNPEQGAPLRLLVPDVGLWNSVKCVRGIEFLAKPWPDFRPKKHSR
ncbi:MAG: molybdopterin-dependent oxidoreductase [bacterium]|nr:molybdopterin-dependent oxidoreductase [bacterium]